MLAAERMRRELPELAAACSAGPGDWDGTPDTRDVWDGPGDGGKMLDGGRAKLGGRALRGEVAPTSKGPAWEKPRGQQPQEEKRVEE
jgi:hypothetical protein